MEQTKRQQLNNAIEGNKRKKITFNTHSLPNDCITRFEDLSNETFYEIFDFLDFCQVYDAFSDLNTRFENLLFDPTLPIKIDLSLLSKSRFERYYTQIIIPNQHRIKSFYLPNQFIINLTFSPLSILSEFTRLEYFVLHKVESKCLKDILIHLRRLPSLSSLTIETFDRVLDLGAIHREIFRLSSLKYCKISFILNSYDYLSLPPATEFSPIEHLIITHKVRIDETNTLLSYVPLLRHLSIHLSRPAWRNTPTETHPIVLNQLRHLSLEMDDMEFDQFKLFPKNLFHYVRVLYITSMNGRGFLDGNQWREFIESDMPNLQIFDMRFSSHDFLWKGLTEWLSKIDEFNSSFWFERKWFFENQVERLSHHTFFNFYSIHPYRRRYYSLCENMPRQICPTPLEQNINSVHSLRISSKQAAMDCKIYFPNVTQLSINLFESIKYQPKLRIVLNNILPLKQITKLVIKSPPNCFFTCMELMELLHCTPNVYRLEVDRVPHINFGFVSFENNNRFRSLSKTNNIRELIMKNNYPLEKTKWLINFCSHLQHLTSDYYKDEFYSLVQYLFSEHNDKTRYMSSLYVPEVSYDLCDKLKIFGCEKVLNIHHVQVSIVTWDKCQVYFWR